MLQSVPAPKPGELPIAKKHAGPWEEPQDSCELIKVAHMASNSKTGEILSKPFISDVTGSRKQEGFRPVHETFGMPDCFGYAGYELLKGYLKDVVVPNSQTA